MDSWKIFWVEMSVKQCTGIPGVAAMDEQSGHGEIRLVSNSPRETEAALSHSGIRTIRTQAMELDGILALHIHGNRAGDSK